MLSLIIQKELRDNLLNFRFVAACAVSILLIVVTIMTLTSSQRAAMDDYGSRTIAQEDFISHYAHLNRWGWMSKPLRPPARYGFVVQGIDREAQQENFVSDPLPVLISQIDLTTIVTIIMSLMAILFSYNSISGEREAGLLKQMLTANLARRTIIAGKFIGGSISLLIPFTIGLLTGLVFVAVRPVTQLGPVDFWVFLLLLFASWLYISGFYALGLFFSTRSSSSGVAVLKSLFAWVVLVLMLPNISPFLAAGLYRIPSKTKIDMETWKLQGEERDQMVDQGTKDLLRSKFPEIGGYLRDSWDVESEKLKQKADTDPAFRERYEQYKKAWMEMVREVNRRQQEKIRIIRQEFEQRSKHQERLATMFASVSPLADYVFISTGLAEAGIQADDEWDKQLRQYQTDVDPVLEKKYDDAIRRDPKFTHNDFLDMRDVPRFQYRPPRLTDKLDAAMPYFGVLALFNILFLTGGWVSFLRYDVR